MCFFWVTDLELQSGLSINFLTKQAFVWILDSHVNGNPFALLQRLWILAWEDRDGDCKGRKIAISF